LKFWSLKVDSADQKTQVSTKIKFDVDETIEEALVRIKEKLPIDSSKEYALYIQGSGVVLKRESRFCDYPQLASEKVSIDNLTCSEIYIGDQSFFRVWTTEDTLISNRISYYPFSYLVGNDRIEANQH
jgi:hypothetical protein